MKDEDEWYNWIVFILSDEPLYIILILVIILVFCCGFTFCCFKILKKKEEKKSVEYEMDSNISYVVPETASLELELEEERED